MAVTGKGPGLKSAWPAQGPRAAILYGLRGIDPDSAERSIWRDFWFDAGVAPAIDTGTVDATVSVLGAEAPADAGTATTTVDAVGTETVADASNVTAVVSVALTQQSNDAGATGGTILGSPVEVIVDIGTATATVSVSSSSMFADSGATGPTIDLNRATRTAADYFRRGEPAQQFVERKTNCLEYFRRGVPTAGISKTAVAAEVVVDARTVDVSASPSGSGGPADIGAAAVTISASETDAAIYADVGVVTVTVAVAFASRPYSPLIDYFRRKEPPLYLQPRNGNLSLEHSRRAQPTAGLIGPVLVSNPVVDSGVVTATVSLTSTDSQLYPDAGTVTTTASAVAADTIRDAGATLATTYPIEQFTGVAYGAGNYGAGDYGALLTGEKIIDAGTATGTVSATGTGSLVSGETGTVTVVVSLVSSGAVADATTVTSTASAAAPETLADRTTADTTVSVTGVFPDVDTGSTGTTVSASSAETIVDSGASGLVVGGFGSGLIPEPPGEDLPGTVTVDDVDPYTVAIRETIGGRLIVTEAKRGQLSVRESGVATVALTSSVGTLTIRDGLG